MMVVQKLRQTWNPRPVTRELLENTFDRLAASKWKTHLTDETLSEVLKIKAALLAEKPLPLDRLMTIADEDRLEVSRRGRRKRRNPCGGFLLMFLARLCRERNAEYPTLLKHEQALKLVLISVFNDVTAPKASFGLAYAEACSLPSSDREQTMTPQKCDECNPHGASRERIEQTFELLMTSKPEVFLTEEVWSEVLKIRAALSAETSVPLEIMSCLVNDDLMSRRLDQRHKYVCSKLFVLFLARLCLVHTSEREVLLKHDQSFELMLISVFSDAVAPEVSFLTAYEQICGVTLSRTLTPLIPEQSPQRRKALRWA